MAGFFAATISTTQICHSASIEIASVLSRSIARLSDRSTVASDFCSIAAARSAHPLATRANDKSYRQHVEPEDVDADGQSDERLAGECSICPACNSIHAERAAACSSRIRRTSPMTSE